MYCTISPNKTKSSVDLVAYLDKENSLSGKFVQYLDKEAVLEENSQFFNGVSNYSAGEVCRSIDKNCKGLKSDEARFYSLTFNPSKKEIEHLKVKAENFALQIMIADKEKIFPDKQKLVDDMMVQFLQDYTNQAMDAYAKNFNRKGVNSSEDLVWFGRVEKNRYWKKSSSKEVQYNEKIFSDMVRLLHEGESEEEILRLKGKLIKEKSIIPDGRDIPVSDMLAKAGDNYHIHVIVSRKDKTQKISLSPLANSKGGTNHVVNGKNCAIGFARMNYWRGLEATFDRSFLYERGEKEKIDYFVSQKKIYQQDERPVTAKSVLQIQEAEGINILDIEDDLFLPSGEQLKIPSIQLAEKYKLSSEEYLYIKEVATRKGAALEIRSEDWIEQETQKIIQGFENRAKIIIPALPDMELKSKRIKVKQIAFLTPKDLKNIEILADEKLLRGWGTFKEKQLQYEIERIQNRYYSTGEILVHNMSKEIEIDNKYRKTGINLLTEKDYLLLSSEAKIRAEARVSFYTNTTKQKDLKGKTKSLTGRYQAIMENSYYSKGNLFGCFKDNKNPKFVSTFKELDREDYKNLYIIAKREIELKYDFPITAEVFDKEVEAVVDRLDMSYYSRGFIPVPADVREKIVITDPDRYNLLMGNTLSCQQHQMIEDLARERISFYHPCISGQEGEKLVNAETFRLQNEYYRTGKIIVPANLNYNAEIFEKSQFSLTEHDAQHLVKIAETLVQTRVGELQQTLVNSEISAIEKEYLTTGKISVGGEINIPKGNISVTLLGRKGQELNKEDYENIWAIALLKIEKEGLGNIGEGQKQRIFYSKVKEIERGYYLYGKITVPVELKFSGEKYFCSEQKALTGEQLQHINTISANLIENKDLADPKAIRSEEAYLKAAFANQYYQTGEIIIPANYDCPDKIFKRSKVTELSKYDYLVIREALSKQIDTRYLDLSPENKEKLLAKAIRKLEKQYYHQGNCVITKTDRKNINKNILQTGKQISIGDYSNLYKAANIYVQTYDPNLNQEDRSKMVESFVDRKENQFYSNLRLNKVILPLSAEYKNLSKEFVASPFRPLAKHEYEQIEKVAQARARGRGVEKDVRAIREYVSMYEKEYLKTGKIIIPNTPGISSDIFVSKDFKYLNQNDYVNLGIAGIARIQNMGKVLSKDNIKKEIDRFEAIYYKYGSVTLPKAEYRDLDKEKFRIRKNGSRLGRRLANIAVNYVLKDAPGMREAVKVGRNGIYCYKTVKSISQYRKAAIVAKQASKTLTKVAVMKTVTKAIPYVNVVATAVGLVSAFAPSKGGDRR